MQFLPCVPSPMPRWDGSVMSIICRSHASLPRVLHGSAPMVVFSRLSQRSLPLQPAGLPPALSRLLSRQLRRVSYPPRRDDSYRDVSTVSRAGLPPAGITQHHDARRVESWRGGLGRDLSSLFATWFPSGATLFRPCPVSSSRSSNWTCGVAASSSRTGFISSIRALDRKTIDQTD